MFRFLRIIKEKNSLERELELYKYKNQKIQEELREQKALVLQYKYLYNDEMQKRFEILQILSEYEKNDKRKEH